MAGRSNLVRAVPLDVIPIYVAAEAAEALRAELELPGGPDGRI